jgi:hypothetical protein
MKEALGSFLTFNYLSAALMVKRERYHSSPVRPAVSQFHPAHILVIYFSFFFLGWGETESTLYAGH